jgi:hypothetical protein
MGPRSAHLCSVSVDARLKLADRLIHALPKHLGTAWPRSADLKKGATWRHIEWGAIDGDLLLYGLHARSSR